MHCHRIALPPNRDVEDARSLDDRGRGFIRRPFDDIAQQAKVIDAHDLPQRAIENLRKAFFPAHLHANNFVGFCNLMGVPIPEVYEVTFVNSEFYRPAQRQQGAPTKLDNPNNPDAPDLFLGSPFCIA